MRLVETRPMFVRRGTACCYVVRLATRAALPATMDETTRPEGSGPLGGARGEALVRGQHAEAGAMLVVGGATMAAVVAVAVLLLGAFAVARVALGAAVIVGAAAASALLVFVGAAVRELGREVTRRACDARVRRARTQVRTAAEGEGVGADGDAHRSERQGAARRYASTRR